MRIGRIRVYVALHLVGEKSNRIPPLTKNLCKVDLRCALA